MNWRPPLYFLNSTPDVEQRRVAPKRLSQAVGLEGELHGEAGAARTEAVRMRDLGGIRSFVRSLLGRNLTQRQQLPRTEKKSGGGISGLIDPAAAQNALQKLRCRVQAQTCMRNVKNFVFFVDPLALVPPSVSNGPRCQMCS